ncbi:MAG TPA: rhomboid family intramembrane serine protease [Pirellulales bacterium]|nr:rhomboid family intramembrane serine protease [Pirellulales bacterium]
MSSVSHSIRDELAGIGIFIGAIWAVFLLSLAVPSLNLNSYGIQPRTMSGLVGIAAAPFLHENLGHILSNTVPLFILLVLLAGSQARSWAVVIDIVLLGGGLLWLFGRPAYHIGASGLVFGLITFLITSGFLERRIIPLLISLVVGFWYGGTLVFGVLPRLHSDVSWDGHLCSAVAGIIVAYALARQPGKQTAESHFSPGESMASEAPDAQ